MKKKIVISLLLILSFISSMIIPIKVAKAGNGNEDNGMVIDKTVTANADGSYTITLEAYATGTTIISEITEDVPTDIILVLDQSGSMDYAMGTVTYTAYSNNQSTNTLHYGRRHNGGSANLWYPLGGGTYVPVNVTRQEFLEYHELSDNLPNHSGGLTPNANCYWYYRNILYEKDDLDQYKKVTLTRDLDFLTWVYTYEFSNGDIVVSRGNNTRPRNDNTFVLHTPLYYSTTNYLYTYTYVDNNGVTQTIGTSIGDSTRFTTTLYQRIIDENAGGTRLAALKTAVTNFANAVANKAAGTDGVLGTTDDINHRIAIVGFASQSGHGNNTELLSISGNNSGTVGVAYNNITNQNLIDVLQSMDTAAGQTMVTNAINALAAEGATRVDLGMDMAQDIINANPIGAEEQRNRVIIVFTDGAPTSSNGFEKAVANNAISIANTGIKGAGIEVYTIGIFAGADASSPGVEPTGDLSGSSSSLPAASNWFMQSLSSNNGVVQNPSYYMAAADADTLNNIFQQISQQIEDGSSSTTLNAEAIIKDIIAPAFTLPENTTADDIVLETWACTGQDIDNNYTWSKNPDAMGATAVIGSTNPGDPTTTNNHLSITGFDFSDNYVSPIFDEDDNIIGYRGHKLVIKFTVKPRPGFLGGNGVETNTSAGVYENASATDPILTFPKPIVDVAVADINITTPSEAKNVYLLHDVTFDNIHEGITVKIGTVSLDLGPSAVNWGLQPWQNECLDIAVTYSDANGNPLPLEGWQNITEDMMYSVTVTIQPKKTGTIPATGSTQTGNTAINVFKPELNFKDISVYYGAAAPTDSEYAGSLATTLWKHGNVLSTDVIMIGDAPVLDLTYTPEAGKISAGKINTKQDIKVDVAVAIGTEDVMEYTTFVHTPCDPACGWNEPAPLDGSPAFLLHVNTCSLTITKSGGAADESYVFDILKDGTKYSEVTIWGNGSKTIYELPVGNYTIQENTGWSWRYTANNGSGVNLNAGSPAGSITCLNTKSINKWLNGYSPVVTNIFGVSH